jgi:hypothetical protein
MAIIFCRRLGLCRSLNAIMAPHQMGNFYNVPLLRSVNDTGNVYDLAKNTAGALAKASTVFCSCFCPV